MAEINNNDKIYEAYMGKLGFKFQKETQARFGWLANSLEGERILDVGCSQGIFPILMARENKKVIGLDIAEKAIEFANELRNNESEQTRDNVEFIVSSFNQYETDKKFDTIILAEVIEHLLFPREFIEKSYDLLNEKGILLITIPFGITSYFDHKKDYYLCDVLELVSDEFSVVEVHCLDNWLAIKLQRNDVKGEKKDYKVFKELENGLNKFEMNIKLSNVELQNKVSELVKKNTMLEQEKIKKDYEIKEIKMNHENDTKSLNEKFKEETKDMQDKYEKQIEDTKSEYEEQLKSSKVQYEQQLKTSKVKYEQQIKALQIEVKKVNNRKIIRIIRKIKKILGIFNVKKIFSRIKTVERKALTNTIDRVNMDFYKNIDNLIEKIPDSNGSEYYSKVDINIGIVTDEYMYNYYKDAVNLFYITYDNYKEIVDKVDMVLFVTCWKGLNREWVGISRSEKQEKLFEIFDYARGQEKKIIFQTIEDPSNYDIYLPIAKRADYIFTTSIEKIEDYKKDTCNQNVYLLDYGVNPMFHNPVGFRVKNETAKDCKEVLFAGSWAERYKERCQDASMIFDGVIESNNKLVIIDRNSEILGYEFPKKYYKYTIPAVEHTKLQKVHKLYDWAVNLNSIKYSQTMCAMRVYELQALGVLMLSNYSTAVNNIFPNIFMIENSAEIKEILNKYSDLDIYKMQVEGIRNVFTNHTVYQKLNYIFSKIGREDLISKPRNVAVIVDNKTEKIINMFNKQTFKEKVLLEKNEINNESIKDYDYIAFFTENIDYGENYLQDMINGFVYTNSDFITIDSSITDNKVVGNNHVFVDEAKNKYTSVFAQTRFDYEVLMNNDEIKGNGYAIDPFSINSLTKQIEGDKEISVIVPIYNNGKHLKYKCFNSLLRSSLFNKMEIILVDDGSSDEETIRIINELKDNYTNVKTFFFNDGGSGTASRPRNKGVELSTCEYVTYLDPDNEAINDGYYKLFNIIKDSKYDFVFGSIVKLDTQRKLNFRYFTSDTDISNPRETLVKNNFKPQSIQACIIRRDLIVNNNILNPVGAAGQDSLFFQELMLNAKKVYYLNLPIHLYYAARTGSIVNSLNHKFFEKFYILEEYQVKKLKEYNIFDIYYEKRYQYFMDNWYLKKLELVTDEEERKLCVQIIDKIKKLYGDKND